MQIIVEVSDDKIIKAVERANIAYWGLPLVWDAASLTLTLVQEDDLMDLSDVMNDDDSIEDTFAHDENWAWLPKDVITLGPEQWAKSMSLLAQEGYVTFTEVISPLKGDEYTGDLLIQFAAFGEEKYA